MRKLSAIFLLCLGLATPSYAENPLYLDYFLCAFPKAGRALGEYVATTLFTRNSALCTAACSNLSENLVNILTTHPLVYPFSWRLKESGLKREDILVLILLPCVQSCTNPEKPIGSYRALDAEIEKIVHECTKFSLEVNKKKKKK